MVSGMQEDEVISGMQEDEVVERSKTFVKLVKHGRLAPLRKAQLLKAATADSAPAAPEPWECCGSHCQPCVKQLHKEVRDCCVQSRSVLNQSAQELKCWQECHPDW